MKMSYEKINKHYSEFFGKHAIADIIVCSFDRGLEILYISAGLLNLFGCELEEILGKSYVDFVVGGNQAAVFEEIANATKSGNVYSIERRLSIKNDKKFWIMERGGLVHPDDDTKILKLIITDISKQKEIEENLRITEKRYELVMNFSEVSLFDYDLKTKQMIVNYLDEDSYGIPQIIENMPDYVVETGIVMPKSVETFLGMYKRIFAGEPFASGKLWTIDINGEERLLELQLVTIYDHDGQPVRAIGVHKDITDKLLLEQEKAYNKAITTSMTFAYEANITTDKLLSKNEQWILDEGLSSVNSFSDLIAQMSTNIVAVDYKKLFIKKLSIQAIIEAWSKGSKIVTVVFSQLKKDVEYWYEKSLNIIYDEISDEYLVRCYVEDITKKHRAMAEQRHYEAMISKSQVVYEVNISKNQAVAGHGDWKKRFNIEVSSDYTKMIQEFAIRAIYHEDREQFLKTFRREHLLKEFRKDHRVHACDYRCKINGDKWQWRRCTLHLFEDPEFGYIRGFAYIEHIHETKTKELELLYKSQHDLLSNLYNKATVQEKINEYLLGDGEHGMHALFIVDLDNFKDINDQFGHVFGDVVISETASKLRAIFRDADLIGRIGGDEFVVLMKNISQRSTANVKAKQICEMTYGAYNKNGHKYAVSASVGVAYYKEHGGSFEELYHNADVAMYNSKEYGRNRFSVYNENMSLCHLPGQQPENRILVRGRNFEDYISAYIFQLLYDYFDPSVAIRAALEVLCKHYNFCRAYIFEDTISGKQTSNTFEWCQEGVASQIDSMQNINYEELDDLANKFSAEGVFLLDDISMANGKLRDLLNAHDVKSMLIIAMKRDGVLKGFLGFDNCVGSTTLDPEQIWDLLNLTNIISSFINQIRNNEQYERANELALSVLNGIDAYLYVCNPNTYEILFINDKIKSVMPQAAPGKLCYKAFAGLDKPCRNCFARKLIDSRQERLSEEYYNKRLKHWFKCNASWLEGIGQERVCLLNHTDISTYKK